MNKLSLSIKAIVVLTAAVVTGCTDRRGERQDQGRTEACWIYAMTECVEREMWSTGDTIELSRQWLVARCLEEQTLQRRLSRGAMPVNMRGVGPEALRLIDAYGLVPFVHEKSRALNSRTLQRRLTLLADQSTATHGSVTALLDSATDLLPHFTVARHDEADPAASTFYLYGMQYTARSFAESIMYRQHWQWFASSTHHPYGKPFALEVADNRHYHEYTNLPMTDILQRTLRSLRQGHPVYWEMGRRPSTQPGGGGADSDHAMAIIGLHTDTKGKIWLVCQNSYGHRWGHGGTTRVSLPYFTAHTCNVGILGDANECFGRHQ